MTAPDLLASVTSWVELSERLTRESEGSRGYLFERIVRHYLRTDPIYRAKLSQVWLRTEVPADIQTQLNLPHRDMGIDLVAQTHAGEFWAVQAKYRSNADASLTFAELSTFASLAFTVCRGISYGLVCTTTARIPKILEGLENLGDLTSEVWTALDSGFFKSLDETLRIGAAPARPVARTPKSHQERAVANAVAHFQDKGNSRGKLISPCSSGKSLTACWTARALGSKRILIAVPSIALIRQTLETWMHEAVACGDLVDWLCVCSDDDAAKVERTELISHVHELGIPCDTKPNVLSEHLVRLTEFTGQVVVITTYQSSPVLATAAKAAGFEFDLAVLDEAHRTTGPKAKSFAHLLAVGRNRFRRRCRASIRRRVGSIGEPSSAQDTKLFDGLGGFVGLSWYLSRKLALGRERSE